MKQAASAPPAPPAGVAGRPALRDLGVSPTSRRPAGRLRRPPASPATLRELESNGRLGPLVTPPRLPAPPAPARHRRLPPPPAPAAAPPPRSAPPPSLPTRRRRGRRPRPPAHCRRLLRRGQGSRRAGRAARPPRRHPRLVGAAHLGEVRAPVVLALGLEGRPHVGLGEPARGVGGPGPTAASCARPASRHGVDVHRLRVGDPASAERRAEPRPVAGPHRGRAAAIRSRSGRGRRSRPGQREQERRQSRRARRRRRRPPTGRGAAGRRPAAAAARGRRPGTERRLRARLPARVIRRGRGHLAAAPHGRPVGERLDEQPHLGEAAIRAQGPGTAWCTTAKNSRSRSCRPRRWASSWATTASSWSPAAASSTPCESTTRDCRPGMQ